jgi:hypothetical protein
LAMGRPLISDLHARPLGGERQGWVGLEP